MELSLGLVGFGNVGQALAHLIELKNPLLRAQYNLNLSVMGIATARHGCAIDGHGLDISRVLETIEQGKSIDSFHAGEPIPNTLTFIRKVPADVIVETTILNPNTGQPATDHVRTALRLRRHVVTSNKGPVAFAYQELCNLAEQNNCAFLYESTVMDGVPVFNLLREALPAIEIHRIRGILNSTTNGILTRMAEGITLEDALREMQQVGLAEANPEHDIDGWDATVKIAILANVLMNANLLPADVDRTGIAGITVEQIQRATRDGQVIKLVCEAYYNNGSVKASVKPIALPLSDPLAQVRGTGNILNLETDMIGYLSIGENEATPITTAYGVLADIVNIARAHPC